MQEEKSNLSPETNTEVSGLTLRSMIISIVLMILASIWVSKVEMIGVFCQISESVPSIPAVAGLILLVLLNPFLKKLGKMFSLKQAEILIIYCILCVGIPIFSVGVLRMFFPFITVPYYFATPENNFEAIQKFLPKWFVPSNMESIRTMYEGSTDGKIPWGDWIIPLLIWTAFFVVLFLTMFCVISLFRKQWNEKERLTFPLIYLPLELVKENKDSRELVTGFLKNPLMWAGFAIAALYNILNMWHAFNPSVPALGSMYDIGALFTERPFNALRPLNFMYSPAVVGLAYLVSLEVSFSIWFFYLLEKMLPVFSTAAGYQVPGFPFFQEQGIGAYLALAIFLFWLNKNEIIQVTKKALNIDKSIDDSKEPISYKFAFWGILLGIGFLTIFGVLAGISVIVILLYIIIILAVAIVYARIRAETGTPLMWLFPFYQQKKMLVYTFGTKALSEGGTDFSNLAGLSSLSFIARGYFPSLIGYQIESVKIAESANIKKKQVIWALIFAVVVALMIGYWQYFSMYYKYGANTLEDGTTQGGYRTWLAIWEYSDLSASMRAPRTTDVPRVIACGIGFVVVTGLIVLRRIFLRLPFHPLGYAMSVGFGEDRLWAAFFLIWIIKGTILKLGSIKLYRHLIPFFIGIMLGHFFTAGVVWGLLSVTGKEIFRQYCVFFG